MEKSRANAATMPKIYHNKLRDFFKTLTDIGLLDQTNETISSVTTKVSNLISLKNPTH